MEKHSVFEQRGTETQTQMERGTGRGENKETETLRQKDRSMYRDRQGTMVQRDSDFDKKAVIRMSIQQERGDTESRGKRYRHKERQVQMRETDIRRDRQEETDRHSQSDSNGAQPALRCRP